MQAEQLQHLADYVLERLADGLASNEGQEGAALAEARETDLTLALQRLLGAIAGDAAELRLLALVGRPASDYLFGACARSLAEARMCAAADARAAQVSA